MNTIFAAPESAAQQNASRQRAAMRHAVRARGGNGPVGMGGFAGARGNGMAQPRRAPGTMRVATPDEINRLIRTSRNTGKGGRPNTFTAPRSHGSGMAGGSGGAPFGAHDARSARAMLSTPRAGRGPSGGIPPMAAAYARPFVPTRSPPHAGNHMMTSDHATYAQVASRGGMAAPAPTTTATNRRQTDDIVRQFGRPFHHQEPPAPPQRGPVQPAAALPWEGHGQPPPAAAAPTNGDMPRRTTSSMVRAPPSLASTSDILAMYGRKANTGASRAAETEVEADGTTMPTAAPGGMNETQSPAALATTTTTACVADADLALDDGESFGQVSLVDGDVPADDGESLGQPTLADGESMGQPTLADGDVPTPMDVDDAAPTAAPSGEPTWAPEDIGEALNQHLATATQ